MWIVPLKLTTSGKKDLLGKHQGRCCKSSVWDMTSCWENQEWLSRGGDPWAKSLMDEEEFATRLSWLGQDHCSFILSMENIQATMNPRRSVLLYMAAKYPLISFWTWPLLRAKGRQKLTHGQKMVPKAMLEDTKQATHQQPEVCYTDLYPSYVGAQTS